MVCMMDLKIGLRRDNCSDSAIKRCFKNFNYVGNISNKLYVIAIGLSVRVLMTSSAQSASKTGVVRYLLLHKPTYRSFTHNEDIPRHPPKDIGKEAKACCKQPSESPLSLASVDLDQLRADISYLLGMTKKMSTNDSLYSSETGNFPS